MQRTILRRVYLSISLAALLLTAIWSRSVNLRESKHAGEPLPILTLAQLATQPATAPTYIHLQDAVPDFSEELVKDHSCHRIECVDHFTPLSDAAHPKTARVAVLSLIRTFPGDVGEARHPFNLQNPVIEGTVDSDGLFPDQIHDLRARGILVDEQTVVFKRQMLQGKVPPADSIDVLLPWVVGLPVTLLTALVAFTGLRSRQRQI